MEERVTVIMGIYNCAGTLGESLDSLLAQTYQAFKVIMCDDGSNDNTADIAMDYVNRFPNKFILIRNSRNMGLNYTLNRCLDHVDTEYLARMDGDDISLPNRFEKEIYFLDEHSEFALVSVPMIYFDEEGDFFVGTGHGEVKKKDFISGSPITHAPCMARSEAFKKVGGYTLDKRLLRVEDYHLWFKIYAAGMKAYMMDEPLYKMRDGRQATDRRTFRNRLNEMYVKHIGFKMIGLPTCTQLYCLKPLLLGFLPKFAYKYLRRRRMNNKK